MSLRHKIIATILLVAAVALTVLGVGAYNDGEVVENQPTADQVEGCRPQNPSNGGFAAGLAEGRETSRCAKGLAGTSTEYSIPGTSILIVAAAAGAAIAAAYMWVPDKNARRRA